MRKFWKLLREEKAATAIEYAMLVAFIALAAMVAIVGMTGKVVAMWNVVSNNTTSSL
jgi:Flp pilus assembly pilin Flp